MMTLRELRVKGNNILKDSSVEDSAFDSLQLLLRAFSLTADEYYLSDNRIVTDEEADVFLAFISRRVNGEPLQYILGKWDFYESSFFVGEGVLIPRPETEELVEMCINAVKENGYKVVYDLCSGSGCIGLSIAKACPETYCYLFELYDEALYFTRKNLAEMQLSNATVIKCDVLSGCFEDIPECGLLVSNPPYIPHCEIDSLQKEVRKEPSSALDGGHDGLDFYREIKDKWSHKINEGGFVAFECAENQCDSIVSLFSESFDCSGKTDAFGLDRFVTGTKLRKG